MSKFSELDENTFLLSVLKDGEEAFIHRHSLIDKDLKKVERFYLNNFEHIDDEDKVKAYKYVRTEYLKKFLSGKKSEFKEINSGLYNLINNLFLELMSEYERQKKDCRLKVIIGNWRSLTSA